MSNAVQALSLAYIHGGMSKCRVPEIPKPLHSGVPVHIRHPSNQDRPKRVSISGLLYLNTQIYNTVIFGSKVISSHRK